MIWVAALAAEAAQVKLVAEPSRLAVGQTGTVHVQVAFEGGGGGAIDTGRPPPVPVGAGLRVAFVGQTARFQTINGRITRIFDLQYRLTAVQPGTWEIGPVEVGLSDGSKVAASAIPVVVAERAPSPDDEKFRIEAGFLTPLAWEGQVVPYRLEFTSRIPGASVRWTLPEFKGLRQPQHGAPTQTQYRVEDPSGPISITETLIPLVAVGTGNRDQAPATAIVQIPVGPTDPFGLRRVREQAYPTKGSPLEVRPLPPAPAGFSGLVGDFTVSSEVADGKVAVGQSVPWRLVISGDGALEGVTLPSYEAPSVSMYESGRRVVGDVDGRRYSATGTWERVIVPTEPGEIDLPDLSLVTFSTSEGRYVTHTLDLPRLTVVEGREGDGTVQSFSRPGEADVDPVAVELRPIYTWGRATAPRLGGLLPPSLGLAALPGVGALGWELLALLRARRRQRAEAAARPPTATEVLTSLPADPTERLAALDAALRLAEAQSVAVRGERDARILDLRARLGRVRFGGAEPDPALEDDVRRLVDAIDREAA